jgi:hypothetical protein
MLKDKMLKDKMLEDKMLKKILKMLNSFDPFPPHG